MHMGEAIGQGIQEFAFLNALQLFIHWWPSHSVPPFVY